MCLGRQSPCGRGMLDTFRTVLLLHLNFGSKEELEEGQLVVYI